jgi:hypothetical protein
VLCISADEVGFEQELFRLIEGEPAGVVGVVFAGGGDAGGAFGEVFAVVEVAGVGRDAEGNEY